ncbi:MAG: 30S ribosomal protein S28e [Nanoarchaeota archaeon]
MEKKYPARQDQQQEKKKDPRLTQAIPAVIEEVVGKTDTRGAITQVRCKVLDGPEKNKILRRNVKGPIREKDIIMLRETEIEARSLVQAKRGKKR